MITMPIDRALARSRLGVSVSYEEGDKFPFIVTWGKYRTRSLDIEMARSWYLQFITWALEDASEARKKENDDASL